MELNKRTMNLQQPLNNSNTSCRSAMNSGDVLLPTINNNLPIKTTATVEDIVSTAAAIATSSPSTSPINTIVNHHHNTNRNSQNLVTQKSNQVSTVLLYNIPIVSLYIEGQERLCLAQISNTLLKQFSYNEIHNRRVALGITCVQCTPVQLEILRRAGAMPVSSRRCGMITRREAERLCKSFLGDNTPPRLPDDFAFNVQHKCSWGCRGSFLPSRYNSSRAKCIKCHYCGLFFSPNKFIFHSHRIGPGDKYVQPDAANFNSWRRHMMLSGQPPQEVIYAWEDVKAMFNGGTRKRLMTNNSSSPLSRVLTSSPNSCSAGATSSSMNRDQNTDDGLSVNGEPLINNIKKIQKSSNSVNTVTAAAAVVGVTAVAVGSTVRPLNLHFQTSTAAGLATESSYSVGTDMHLIPAAALSRSFMMDYMWQHAHQAAKTGAASDIQTPDNLHSNMHYSSSVNNRWSSSTNNDITRNLTQIMNTSAFKPVVQQQLHQPSTETHLTLTKTRRRHSTPQLSTKDANESNNTLTLHSSHPAQIFSSDDGEHDEEDGTAEVQHLSLKNDSKHLVPDDSEVLDDDILVDIETTEDEKPLSFSTPCNAITTTCSRASFTGDNTESHDEVEINALDNDKHIASDEDVIDVEHNDNDDSVLEFASLTPLAIIKHTKENDRLTVSEPRSTFRGTKDLDKLYSVDFSNAENVPPSTSSISPKSNSISSCSQLSECFYAKGKNHHETEDSPNSVPKNISTTPDIYDDHNINLNATSFEKPTKSTRKRPCEKSLNYENEKITWKNEHDSTTSVIGDIKEKDFPSDIGNTLDYNTKFKKKTIEASSKEAHFIEALAQKYEITYYNNANGKNNYANNNNLISNNNNSNEFWQMARLCMQRPMNNDQNNKVQQHQEHINQQQLTRLPTFYYRQQQFLLSPAEHSQQQNNSSPIFPATQQVYLHLQQHQQAVQNSKSHNNYSNEILQSSSTHSSSHIPLSNVENTPESSANFASAYINMRQNNHDPTSKPQTCPNGIVYKNIYMYIYIYI
ncbi:SKI family transcriptional corepressor 2 [Lucilia cuprina]|nr:SKI family transcriptional corepressor 2 [Lucilia cuprina]